MQVIFYMVYLRSLYYACPGLYFKKKNQASYFMERDIKVIFVTILLLLSCFWGAVSATLKIFPYQQMKAPVIAMSSLMSLLAIEDNAFDIRWVRLAQEAGGVRVFDRENSAPGYTLYVSTHDSVARLIDRDGTLLYQWQMNFDDVWPDQSHLMQPFTIDESYFYLRDFYLFPNGDLLLAVAGAGITPWGVGLVKLDKNSRKIWKYDGFINNDFYVTTAGTIYAVIHKIRYEPVDQADNVLNVPLQKFREPMTPFLEDHIVVLDPDGHEIKAISLYDALERSDYSALLKQIDDDGKGDFFHTNAIEQVQSDVPGVPWLKKGYLLLSIRNLNALVVLDPETEQIIYAMGLKTRMQHDVDLLDNGHLMLFDNRGSLTSGGYTRVVEMDPVTQEIVWLYEGTPDAPFESSFWGTQQRLANGNILIVKAEEGALVEVTPAGTVVWDYHVPLFQEKDGENYVATVTHAERIAPDYIEFSLKDQE